jgi:hypothetical protein
MQPIYTVPRNSARSASPFPPDVPAQAGIATALRARLIEAEWG